MKSWSFRVFFFRFDLWTVLTEIHRDIEGNQNIKGTKGCLCIKLKGCVCVSSLSSLPSKYKIPMVSWIWCCDNISKNPFLMNLLTKNKAKKKIYVDSHTRWLNVSEHIHATPSKTKPSKTQKTEKKKDRESHDSI